MLLRLRMPSKFPPGVPLDQSTPWEYLGQLSSLSSLAITSAPDSAQTATGRSFQNLHNLRELDLPAGLSQLAMRTILNALPALQSLSGGVIGWASDPGQVTLTPQPRSHSPEGCVDRGGVSDRSPGSRRAAAATNTEQWRNATASPDSPHVHASLHPSDRQPHLTDDSRFR